jgi:hypothetical protein
MTLALITVIRTLFCLSALSWLIWPEGDIRAEAISALDVKIEIKVLDFLRDPHHRGKVAVLFDRDNGESRRQAEFTLHGLIEFSALSRSGLAPALVERRELAAARDYAAVLLGPAELQSEDDAMRYGLAHHALVLSIGRDCVRRGKCTVGVTSQPEVEIALSPEMLRQSGIRFADGFQLMVKEY